MQQATRKTSTLTQLIKEHPDWIAPIGCSILVLLGWFALHLGWIGISLFILSAAFVIGGYQTAREGLTTLFQAKQLDVDLLMIVAALGAAGLGLWRREYEFIIDGAVLILIFAISGALEGYAMQRTERGIRSLMSLTSDTARLSNNGIEQVISIEKLQIGDEIIVKPGELIPTDAVIIEGYSTLNEAPITGESMPVEKTVGALVFAGTINNQGALRLKVHQPPESSHLQQVIRLVEQAQTEAPPSQQFIERFERGYAIVVVLTGIMLATLPPFVLGWTWENTIYRSLIFLVVASPCALMAAIMPTLLSGMANGTRHGILFKSGTHLETLGRVRVIAFDKTGTLTTGQPQVVEVIPVEGQSQSYVLKIAASLEAVSEHPIGIAIAQRARSAIANSAQQQHMTLSQATAVQALPGKGITGEVEGKQIFVGNTASISQEFSNLTLPLLEQSNYLEESGKTVVWVVAADQVLGIIAVADIVRSEAAATVAKLKQLGINLIVMLTGDNERTANSIAKAIGVDEVYAGLLPEDKVKVIRELQQKYQTVAMVGDGINDAPALAQASVGIAMGVTGSDVALETADVILMADRLEKLAYAISLGRRSHAIVKQNIAFAIGFILLLLVANFTGNINMPLGVIGHEGSTVLVTLSGLRLLKG